MDCEQLQNKKSYRIYNIIGYLRGKGGNITQISI